MILQFGNLLIGSTSGTNDAKAWISNKNNTPIELLSRKLDGSLPDDITSNLTIKSGTFSSKGNSFVVEVSPTDKLILLDQNITTANGTTPVMSILKIVEYHYKPIYELISSIIDISDLSYTTTKTNNKFTITISYNMGTAIKSYNGIYYIL